MNIMFPAQWIPSRGRVPSLGNDRMNLPYHTLNIVHNTGIYTKLNKQYIDLTLKCLFLCKKKKTQKNFILFQLNAETTINELLKGRFPWKTNFVWKFQPAWHSNSQANDVSLGAELFACLTNDKWRECSKNLLKTVVSFASFGTARGTKKNDTKS